MPIFPLLLSPLLIAATPAAQTVSLDDARRILPSAPACENVTCLLELAYRADPEAAKLALELYRDAAAVAGVGPDEVLDGGFRGTIHLVPQLPMGAHRKHLAWVSGGLRDTHRFFGQLFANRPPPAYRWQGLQLRFVRSIAKRRPSAYAFGWTIEYNVQGSLNTSAQSVRETLFHELFHLNDEAHDDWSARALKPDYQSILKACGPKPSIACLTPYAPNDTRVRGGTYYAFQQNNGDTVHEYAAELAVRYYKEQSQMLADGKLSKPSFKCGPRVNARVWSALVNEFFDGRDLTPECVK